MQKTPHTTEKFWTKPSLPPASPHRAGHYSGLHPEDQPYQSNMIAIQRPPTEEVEARRLPPQEPEHIELPVIDAETKQETYRQIATPRPRKLSIRAPRRRGKSLLSSTVIRVLLTLSCIFFLLATSIIAFVLMGKRSSLATPVLTATPKVLRTGDTFTLAGSGFGADSLMTFTYNTGKPLLDGNGKPLEAHTNKQGAFSLQLSVPGSWQPGVYTLYVTDEAQKLTLSRAITVQKEPQTGASPSLHLSDTVVDFGEDRAGTTSSKTIMLTNSGDGQITWQESSDVPWLTASPNASTFSGSQNVTLSINRLTTLLPQKYIGQITFKQKDSPISLQLTVSMKIKLAQAALGISTTALNFAASTTQSPEDQRIILQNTGGQMLIWRSSIFTGDGSHWLSINPPGGWLKPNSSAIITVHVDPSQLAVGSYQATINFTRDANAQVSIALNVIAPGNLVVSPPELNFTTVAAQSPATKSVTLQNSGGMALDWTAVATTDTGTWLGISPTGGTLNAGDQVTITVSINGSTLKTGSYQGLVTFSSGSLSQQVAVALSVAAPPSATLQVKTTALNFTTTSGTNPAQQTFSIMNTGNATLNWTEVEDGNGSTFAPVSPTHGSLAAGASATLTVNPSVTSAAVGTLKTFITILDSDSGTTVSSRRVDVTITIQAQAAIMLSATTLNFDASTSINQVLTVTNSGTADLNWTIAQPSGAAVSWLSVDTSSGTLTPNTAASLLIHCDASSLVAGTYTATFIISDSDSGTNVAAKTVNITFVVH